jgi:hypothetical protein
MSHNYQNVSSHFQTWNIGENFSAPPNTKLFAVVCFWLQIAVMNWTAIGGICCCYMFHEVPTNITSDWMLLQCWHAFCVYDINKPELGTKNSCIWVRQKETGTLICCNLQCLLYIWLHSINISVVSWHSSLHIRIFPPSEGY